jgi:hypothetical protein
MKFDFFFFNKFDHLTNSTTATATTTTTTKNILLFEIKTKI